jgi:hypothetical protein
MQVISIAAASNVWLLLGRADVAPRAATSQFAYARSPVERTRTSIRGRLAETGAWVLAVVRLGYP